MAFKFLAFAAFVAVARAGVVAPVAYSSPIAYNTHHVASPVAYASPAYAGYAAPIAKVATPFAYAAPIAKVAYAAKAVLPEPYDPNPQYSYGYGVDDHVTGDSKTQQESRDGDVVHGSYSLTDSDGFRRTVEYTADPIHGFNAVVHREPLVAKVAKIAAPVAYAAPIAKVAYSAPVASYAAPAYYHH